MPTSQTKTVSGQNTAPAKERSKTILREAEQSYVFSWPWLIGGVLVLALLCLSTFGMRTMNMFNMSKQIIEISQGLEEEGNLRGAIDVLSSFLESHKNNPDAWMRQCDLWDKLYKSQNMVSREILSRAIDRQKMAIPYLKDESVKEVRERVLEMELEVAKSSPSTEAWLSTISNAKEFLRLWENHPLAKKVLAMGVYNLFVKAGRRPAAEEFPLDELLQKAWELNHGDIDLAIDYANFIRGVKSDWQNTVGPKLLARDPADRNSDANEIINAMVREHAGDAEAYLARYHYHRANNMLDSSRLDLEPDLVNALEYSPNSPEALQNAGIQMFVSSQIARSQGKIQEADGNRDKAFEYFTKAIDAAPTDVRGYLYLGKWYMASNQVDKALETWNTGHKKNRSFSSELLGEIAYASIDQKLYDQATNAIMELEQYAIMVGPRMRPVDSRNLTVMYGLLRGKMHLAQRDDALAKLAEANRQIEEAQAKNLAVDPELLKLAEDSGLTAENLRNLAVNTIQNRLNSLPEMDYDLSGGTLYSRLEGEGYISLGRLEAEIRAWDKAAEAYEKARLFPTVAALATIQTANAYERANLFDRSLSTLQNGARRYPENSMLRFLYLSALFAQELAKPEPAARNYVLLESELNEVAKLQDKLMQPWRIDTMRIQLQYVQGGGTRQVQQECLSRLRELEGNVKYAEDLGFYAELATQYSSVGAFDDFNRVMNRIHEMPKGESTYYVLRIEDARRRGDTASALFLADEALTVVPDADRQRFARIREALENPESVGYLDPDEEYSRLKNLYDGKKIHDPQTFFELANLAFSRGEVEVAKNIEDRLQQIEGEKTGTLWRYLAVRRLVKQAGGDFNSELLNNARAIQKEIASMRPNWDMTYVLKAEIEKETGNTNEAILAYQEAINRGNRQATVFRDLIDLLYKSGRGDEGGRIRRLAGSIFGAAFFEGDSMFPPAYQGYYEQIYRAIQEGNIGSADKLARDCIKKAIENKEPTDLLMDLNTRIGKLFMDSSNEASAESFLTAVAEQGGKFVFPLAVCYIKMEKTDEAFELFVRELEKPSPDPSILVSILYLMAQAKPSEAVLQKIDRQLERLEPLFTEKKETLAQLAAYWINRDMLDHAIPIYRKGLETDPNNLLILNNLAMLLAEFAKDGGATPVARGEFRENETKRIPLANPQLRKTLILRFPGQTAPKPEDFRFLAVP